MDGKTWRIEKNCETFPDGDGGSVLPTWWNVSDGIHVFRQDYQDDAEDLAALLNSMTPAGHVRLPQDANDAAALVNVGLAWLKEHAPDRLRIPDAQPTKLAWSEPLKPSSTVAYNHATAETPFGRFLVTWKAWKESPSYTVDETPWGDFMGSFGSLQEAQRACAVAFGERLRCAMLMT